MTQAICRDIGVVAFIVFAAYGLFGTLNLEEIVNKQAAGILYWNVWSQPFAFVRPHPGSLGVIVGVRSGSCVRRANR